jgi:Zn-dependent peptidase ImmA (M78 family)
MLFTSGSSQHSHLVESVFDFFNTQYTIESDVEVFHTDLTEDNAFGFTEINGDEQFIQIHNNLSEKDYITTLMHELVHVVQNESGQFDDELRDEEAYRLESVLYKQYVTPAALSTN